MIIILDRGFYSISNINEPYKNQQKFVIGVKLGLKYMKEAQGAERENLRLWSDFQTQFGAYGLCNTIEWEY